MRNTMGAYCGWLWVLAFIFVAGFGSGTANAADDSGDADLHGTPNPDAGNISGAAGDQTIRLKPRNDIGDYKNLQWAFDNVAPGGTVELGPGTFFLGDGKDSPRRTVKMRRGLRVIGKKEGETWRTIIRGGGAMGSFGGAMQLESGPFRIVNESDNHPAVFEDIWIREWACEAIYIEACQGFVLRGCRLSHPANTAGQGIRFVHAIWTSGAKARGDFTVEDNLIELGNYADGLPDDEQLLGVFYSNHDTVRVVNNVITGVDEAIEIIGNRYDNSAQGGISPATGPSEIVVTGNRIDVTQKFLSNRWGGRWAILIAGNLGVDKVRIEDNDITLRGKGYAFGISGENLRITGNKVRFEELDGEYPPGAVTIGFGNLGGRDMGTSLINSVFEDNIFEGSVSGSAISFSSNPANDSHGNRFDLGDSIAKLGAKTTLSLSAKVHDNTFKGDLGTVDDKSPKGANNY